MKKRMVRRERHGRTHSGIGGRSCGDKGLDERNRLIQTGLWVSLILLQMLVVEHIKVYASAEEGILEQAAEAELPSVTVYSERCRREEDCPKPEEFYQAEDGTTYVLVSWEREPVTVQAQSIPVIREGVCEQVEDMAQLPETVMVEAERENQKVQVLCSLQEKTVIREEWQEGFHFPVTFHGYDANSYWLGDCLIEGSKESPRLEGCEELLLAEIGASPECYRIRELQWEGEPYEDDTGELCRDAIASGQKLLRDYRLRYQGLAEYPAYEVWQVAAVYEPVVRIEEEYETSGPDPVLVEIEETDPASASLPEAMTWWERITRTLLITIAVGAVLFFGGLLFLGILWGRRALLPYRDKENRGNNSSKVI